MPPDDLAPTPSHVEATRSRLNNRLQAIGAALASRDDALALLALGSMAQGGDRVDAHSDLDFFVLVRDGAKAGYIDDLSWLAAAHPIAWHFRNTADGCKALMRDGVFCEFAVFELHELASIPYCLGRFVWRREEVDAARARPSRPLPARADPAWLAGEALSSLLIGLHRFARGERLAAMRLVQVHALDRFLELREQVGAAGPRLERDAFAVDRRVELWQAGFAETLAKLAPGYDGTPLAALALLDEVEALQPVCPTMAAEIRRLAAVASLSKR